VFGFWDDWYVTSFQDVPFVCVVCNHLSIMMDCSAEIGGAELHLPKVMARKIVAARPIK
jgi:hypothetical protein